MGNNKALSPLPRGRITARRAKSGWRVAILHVNREFPGLHEKKEKESLHNCMALMYKIVGKIYNNRSKESIVEALQNWRLF